MSDDPRHVVAVTGFVLDAERRVLLVRDARRGWELPGGQVEEGEDLVSALEREIEEESACRVEGNRLLGVYSKLSPPVLVVVLFSCKYLGGEPQAREAAVPEAGWFESDEALALVTHPPSAQRLADALAGTDGVVYRAYRLEPYELERRL